MRKTMIWLSMAIVLPGAVWAQEKIKPPEAQGYVFVAPGGINRYEGILHFGGGAEAYVHKGLGIGIELGYLGPFEGMKYGIGLLSVNGLYDFGRTGARKVSPFLTGGYSLGFRCGVASALNIGGGAHYWFRNRVGLRLEFRDHLSPSDFAFHLWEARVGFAFR